MNKRLLSSSCLLGVLLTAACDAPPSSPSSAPSAEAPAAETPSAVAPAPGNVLQVEAALTVSNCRVLSTAAAT
ncbi:MAG TPA: hypothetical protein VF697_06120, partial [Archangium sp.]